MLWLSLIGCQEPFDADRHDLRGFRIAAISVAPAGPGEPVQVRLAAVVEGRPWSTEPIRAQWGFVEEPEAASEPLIEPEAEGPVPTSLVRPDKDHPGWLALQAEVDGATQAVVVRVPPAAVPATELSGLSMASLPYRIASVEPDALQLNARKDQAGGDERRRIAPGGFARFSIVAPPERPGTIRWMGTGGSFFELDPVTTDWVAGDLRLDDDELEGSRDPEAAGPVTIVSLWLADEDDGTAFRADDLWIGEPPPGLFTKGRFVPAESPPSASWIRGRLEADETSPTGVRLVDAVALDGPPEAFSTASWACAAEVDGAFDPTWLLEQRCAVADIDGQIAEIEVDP
ncbi:MAG: hypothetical protein AAGA48_35390 [Myxococcota bacterium]